MLDDWIGMGGGKGRLKVEPGHPFPETLKDALYKDIPDHRILSTAIILRKNIRTESNPGHKRHQFTYQVKSLV